MTFKFATPSNLLATDNYIGWYTHGNTTTSAVDFPAGGVRGAVSLWAYVLTGTTTAPAPGTTPATSGKVTFSTAGLAPGTYTVYYEFDTVGNTGANQGGTAGGVIGEPVTIRVTPAAQPALQASTHVVTQGGSVSLRFATPSGSLNADNVLAWYSSGHTVQDNASSTSSTPDLAAFTQTGTTTPPPAGTTPTANGTVTFSTSGLTPGVYTVQFFDNTTDTITGGTLAGDPTLGAVTVRVNPVPVPAGTLATSPRRVKAGASVALDYSMPASDVDSGNRIEWLNGGSDLLTSQPVYAFNQTVGSESGTATFDTTGLADGRYDVYLLAPDKAVIAGPVTITVDNTGPQLPSPGQLPGQPDLIANGGAEIGAATLNGGTMTGVPGWTTTGSLNEVQYGATGGAQAGANRTPSRPAAVSSGSKPTRQAAPAQAAVSPGSTLTASSVPQGTNMTVSWSVPSADVSPTNWIGVIPAGSPMTAYEPDWVFTATGNQSTPSSTATLPTSGTASLDTSDLPLGSYDVYLFFNDGYTVLAGPVTVQVKLNTLAPYPNFNSPGSADRGQNFIAAAGGGTSTGTQTIDVSKAAPAINRGNVRFNLGAWLGGSGTSTDAASVTATFLSTTGGTLGTATLGPVTPAMRNDTTELLPENSPGLLPTGTNRVRVTVTVTGSGGQGFADNVSFTISSDAVPAPPSPSAPALDSSTPPPQTGTPNLIVNGGAEIGHGEHDGNSTTSDPGWAVTGLLGEIRYGASDGEGIGNWPTPTTPGPADRGLNFFSGGSGGTSTGTQVIDVSKAAPQIDQGTVSYNLSGWIGGAAAQPDNAQVTATFLSAGGTSLGRATLGPVTPAMRDNTTELLPENSVGTLPEHTAKVKVVMTITGNMPPSRNGHAQGFVDNLSFTLSTPAVPAPPPPTPPKSTVPAFDHVFVIMMENQDRDRVIGNTTQAPYTNSLLEQGADLTQSFGLSHPSDENYTGLAAGSMYNETGNTENAQIPAQQIGDLVSNAGMTWRNYMTLANGPCDLGNHDSYEIDDNPFHQFQDVADNQASCQEHEAPFTDFAQDLRSTTTTPAFSWVGPNGCNEGDNEGCGIAIGDQWLSQTLSTLFKSPAWRDQRSLLIITYDENAPDQGNLQSGPTTQYVPELIPGVVLGSRGTVRPGSSSAVRYTHYSMTRTIEAALGLPAMTGNDYYAQPLTGIWGVPPRR